VAVSGVITAGFELTQRAECWVERTDVRHVVVVVDLRDRHVLPGVDHRS